MKYKFLGKPDKIFPNLKTGKVYDLEVVTDYGKGLFGWKNMFNRTPLVIVKYPIRCPYSNWKTFYKNWKPINNL